VEPIAAGIPLHSVGFKLHAQRSPFRCAKLNAQAALLIHLVKRFPDTVERLAAI